MSGRRAWVRPRRSGHIESVRFERLLHESKVVRALIWRAKRVALDAVVKLYFSCLSVDLREKESNLKR